ncbi:MAG: response regulator [Ignavibacteriota bacterium]
MEAPRILVVDDALTNVELVAGVLDAEGFRTLTASQWPRCPGGRPDRAADLILLDVLMPGESGFETCARLKSDPVTADIPIIFFSSLDDVKSKVAGLKMGGVRLYHQTMHGEEVLARVRVHLRIRETNRAQVEQQRARLNQLRDAQQAILVRPGRPAGCPLRGSLPPFEEAGGDCYDVIHLGPGIFAYFVADISGHGPRCGVPYVGRKGTSAAVCRADVFP